MTAIPEKVTKARIELMLEQPYLASAIARFPLLPADGSGWCRTLATDGYFIYLNTGYCHKKPIGSISFIIAHEVLHCVLGHIDRRGDRNPSIWNLAIDYATNSLLVDFGFRMPDDGLYDRRYRGMTAEDIYQTLMQSDEENEGRACLGQKTCEHGSKGGLDLHLSPDDERGQQLRGSNFPSSAERKRIRIQLTKEICSKAKGTMAGLMDEEVNQANKSEVPWRTLLSHFFAGIRSDDYRMIPPNRKHLSRGIYLPSMGVPGPNYLVAAIDTSGSMSHEELSKVLAEIDALRSVTQCSLTLLQCDTKIQRIQHFDEYAKVSFEGYKVFGGGGTNFVPVFEWIRENRLKNVSPVDALIYLTDGFGDFPRKPPYFPVLWIMTEHSQPEVPFGKVIRMRG